MNTLRRFARSYVLAIGTTIAAFWGSIDAVGFSFPSVDFVNINTGFRIGNEVPGITDAYRWDARDFALGTGGIFSGRSLAGGLTYNYENNLRTNLTWDSTPTQQAFDNAITGAFDFWENRSERVKFNKVATASVLTNRSGTVNNVQGADIDLFSSGNLTSAAAEAAVYGIRMQDGGNVTLTNGTDDYSSGTIVASDIRFNSGLNWTLENFEFVLIHEIGHALGLGDVEFRDFWDTNDTINDVMKINLADPINTPGLMNRGTLGNVFGNHNIQMESSGTRGRFYSHDDRAGYRFLYPVPEPSSLALLLLAACGTMLQRKKR